MREVRHHFELLRRRLSRREKEMTGQVKSMTSGKVIALHKQCRYVDINLIEEDNFAATFWMSKLES